MAKLLYKQKLNDVFPNCNNNHYFNKLWYKTLIFKVGFNTKLTIINTDRRIFMLVENEKLSFDVLEVFTSSIYKKKYFKLTYICISISYL